MNASRYFLGGYAACMAVVILAVTPVAYGAVDMFSMSGTSAEMATTWGALNSDIIEDDIWSMYLTPAHNAGITNEMLIERSAAFVNIAETIAPHWLTQGRAILQAAELDLDVDGDVDVDDENLYLAYIDGYVRNRFLYPPASGAAASTAVDGFHECTSYTVSRDHAEDNAILWHKTRDSSDKKQVVAMPSYVAEEGINKTIIVSHASSLVSTSMVINDKGLCCSSDYPASSGYDYPIPPSSPNRYRGMMSGAIIQYVAETATTCAEAHAIVQDIVDNGWYAPGSVGGSHMLFVDRYGTSLELCINSDNVGYEYHTNDDVYTSRLPTASVWDDLENAAEVDFELFHSYAVREDPVLTAKSVSCMTAEVHPDYPELLTCAWIGFPAKHVAYPIFMGQTAIPMPLADGSAYEMGKSATYNPTLWKAMEKTMHAEKELICQVVVDNINAGTPIPQVEKVLEDWSRTQATAIVGQSTGFTRDYYSSVPAGIRITDTEYTINPQGMDAAFGGFFYSTSSGPNGGTVVKAGLNKFTLIGDHDYTQRSSSDAPFSLRAEGGLYKVVGAMNVEAGSFALAGGRVEAHSLASAGQTWDVTLTSDYEFTGQDVLVDVTGEADITGATLNLALADDYIPWNGSQFTLLRADTILGAESGGQLFGYADGEDVIVGDLNFRIEYLDGSESDSICLTAVSEQTLGLVDNGCPADGLHSYTLTATGLGVTTLAKFTIDGKLHQVFHEGEASEWLGDSSALETDTTDSHVIFGDLRLPDLNGGGTEQITEETIDGGGDSGMGTLNNSNESSYDAYMLLGQPSSDPSATVELMQLVVADGQGFSVDLRLLTSHGHDPRTGSVIVHTHDLTYSLPSASGLGDANRDGYVDENDAFVLAQHWLQSGDWDDGDFNGDGLVNDIDATLLAANWNPHPQSANVPEPSAWIMLVLVMVTLLAYRKRAGVCDSVFIFIA